MMREPAQSGAEPHILRGTLWRAVFDSADPLAPVTGPEGRFHHSGQWAIYGSLTAAGCAVAIARYLRAGDPPRVVVPLQVSALVLDCSGQPDLSMVWQDVRAGGAVAPTWAASDAARASGVQGMLYSSRSRPELSHLVLFDGAAILGVGPALPFVG